MMIIRTVGRDGGDDGMARFTDSPFEYAMAQKPGAVGKKGEGMRRCPSRKLCVNCPYGRGRPCIGVCMKKLLSAGVEND